MPPRAEHCSMSCDCCIMRVDHHCVWMGNCCIGFLNHKFYILYLTYFSLGCLLTTIPFSDQVLFQRLGFITLIFTSLARTVAFLVSAVMFFGFLCLLGLQLRFLFMNQTTYEAGIDFRLKPFKQRFWTKNVMAVFGRRKRDWLNPFKHPFSQDTAT